MNPRADRSTHTQGSEALTVSRQRITPIGMEEERLRSELEEGEGAFIAQLQLLLCVAIFSYWLTSFKERILFLLSVSVGLVQSFPSSQLLLSNWIHYRCVLRVGSFAFFFFIYTIAGGNRTREMKPPTNQSIPKPMLKTIETKMERLVSSILQLVNSISDLGWRIWHLTSPTKWLPFAFSLI